MQLWMRNVVVNMVAGGITILNFTAKEIQFDE